MAYLPCNAQIAAWIIRHGNGQVNVVFEISFHRLNNGDLPVERYIKDVGLLAGMQANAIPFAKLEF